MPLEQFNNSNPTLTHKKQRWLPHSKQVQLNSCHLCASMPAVQPVVPALNKVISVFGIPKVIQADQGWNLSSHVFSQVLKQLRVQHNQSSAYHAHTQGESGCVGEFRHRFLAFPHSVASPIQRTSTRKPVQMCHINLLKLYWAHTT